MRIKKQKINNIIARSSILRKGGVHIISKSNERSKIKKELNIKNFV